MQQRRKPSRHASARLVSHSPSGGVNVCYRNRPLAVQGWTPPLRGDGIGVRLEAEMNMLTRKAAPPPPPHWGPISLCELSARRQTGWCLKAQVIGWVSVLLAGVVVGATAEFYPESHRGSLAAATSAPVAPLITSADHLRAIASNLNGDGWNMLLDAAFMIRNRRTAWLQNTWRQYEARPLAFHRAI